MLKNDRNKEPFDIPPEKPELFPPIVNNIVWVLLIGFFAVRIVIRIAGFVSGFSASDSEGRAIMLGGTAAVFLLAFIIRFTADKLGMKKGHSSKSPFGLCLTAAAGICLIGMFVLTAIKAFNNI